MSGQALPEQTLIEKIRALSPERVAQVEDFVDFLLQRDNRLVPAATKLSEKAFQRVWDNTDDTDHDHL